MRQREFPAVFNTRIHLGESSWIQILLGLALTVWSAFGKPTNDDLDQATEIRGSTFVLAANLFGATGQSFEPNAPELYRQTVWWRWTAPNSGIYAWRTSTHSQRTAVTILEADGLGQFALLAATYVRPATGLFIDNFAPDPQGSFAALGGHTYWIRLDGVRGGVFDGTFPPDPLIEPYQVSVEFQRLDLAPQVNDSFQNRHLLTNTSPVLAGTLLTATAEIGEPAAHEASVKRTLWWEWVAPGRGTATLEFAGTNAPPLAAIYRRAPWQLLDPVATSATVFGNSCARFWHARGKLDFDTEAGEAYLLQLDAFPDCDLSQSFSAQLQFQPAPVNDLISNPTEVSGLDWSLESSNEGATLSTGDPSVPGQTGSSSVWYHWHLPGPGLIQVTTNEPTRFAELGVEVLPPDGGTSGSVWTISIGPCGDPFADLYPPPPFMPVIALFRPIGSVGDQPTLDFQVQGTNEIWAELTTTNAWLQLDGPQGVTGRARLNGHLTPSPSNDALSRAEPLPSAPVRVTGRSAGATAEIGERLPPPDILPHGSELLPRRTVWWRWKAPAAGTWVLRVEVGAGDHAFVVYRGGESGEIAPVAATFQQPALFRAAAGEELQIGVFGVAGFGGNIAFHLVPALLPKLGPPTLERNVLGETSWRFEIPPTWDLPFEVETSPDLRVWAPVITDWFRGAGAFHLPIETENGARFIRFRLGPP
ncbi:MAG: hypothetical protein JNK85_04925 [Verrucomicrobiales bacterium]|nr:hypothetical protein [Verrucomicrobiales bacterium]